MPTPTKNEDKDNFISRCIAYVSKEKPEWEQQQVVAYCYSIWEEHSSESFITRNLKVIKEYLGL